MVVILSLICFTICLILKQVTAFIFLTMACYGIFFIFIYEYKLFQIEQDEVMQLMTSITLKHLSILALQHIIESIESNDKRLLLDRYQSITNTMDDIEKKFNINSNKGYFKKLHYIQMVKKHLIMVNKEADDFIHLVRITHKQSNKKSNYNDKQTNKPNPNTTEWALNLFKLDKTSTDKDIKARYRELAKKYHPDVNGGKDENFKLVLKAYEILKNR